MAISLEKVHIKITCSILYFSCILHSYSHPHSHIRILCIKYKSRLFCGVCMTSRCIIPMEFYTFQNASASSLLPSIRTRARPPLTPPFIIYLFCACSFFPPPSHCYCCFFLHTNTHSYKRIIHIHSHQTMTVVQYRMMVIAWKVVEYKYKTHFRLIKIVLTRNSYSSCK